MRHPLSHSQALRDDGRQIRKLFELLPRRVRILGRYQRCQFRGELFADVMVVDDVECNVREDVGRGGGAGRDEELSFFA